MLEGIRIVDITAHYAGEMSTLILADLGAEVIKIENPGTGSPVRALPPQINGQSYLFTEFNHGKKGITLNLKEEKGRELLHKLVAQSQVVMDNLKPSAVREMGLTYDWFKQANLGIIWASLSGFGHEGPYRDYLSFDIVANAMGGLMHMTGERHGPPMNSTVSVGDHVTALNAVIGVLAAVMHWRQTGQGQRLDISMQDCVWQMAASQSLARLALGRIPMREGNLMPGLSPVNAYKARRDEYVVMCIINNRNWAKLLKVMGKENEAGNPHFASPLERYRHREEVDKLVGDWVAEQEARDVVKILQEADIACGQVYNVSDILSDPHIKARNMVVEITDPRAGPLKVAGSPLKFSATRSKKEIPAPALGQHNEEIYGRLLGISAAEMAQLHSQGII